MISQNKENILKQVTERVMHDKITQASNKKIPLETIISDTIYHERRRLSSEKKKKSVIRATQYWKKIGKKISGTSAEQEKQEILKEIINIFLTEILGNFDPKVYKFTTKVLPISLSVLLNAFSPKIWFSHFPKLPDLSDRLLISVK